MSFFLTIASASASFVAIIGGFIASKLISINGDREAVETQIADLDEEIVFRTQEIDELQVSLDVDDALDFIDSHIEDVIRQSVLSDVYNDSDFQNLDLDALQIYWDRALSLYKKYEKDFSCDDINKDGVPITIASEVMDDKFDYGVCCRLMCGLSENPTIWMMRHSSLKTKAASVEWYNLTFQQRENLSREIDLLQLQRMQLEKRKSALIKPKKMTLGIYIFGGISLFNIFLPLLLCLLLPGYQKEIFDIFQIVCMVFMSLGLVLTFCYLLSLLDWSPKADK